MPQRTRFTTKKSTRTGKAKSRKADSDEPNASPSEEKWETMTHYGSFVVCDADEQEHKFHKGDVATILPTGRDPAKSLEQHQYWVAKIRDIRAALHEDGTNSVWARVQWYYSSKDVSDVIKSFDRNVIGKYERIFSDHYDFVESEAFDCVISMAKFHEDKSEQAYIPRDQFYNRYSFEYKARKLLPKLGATTCICLLPYRPEDTDPSNLMHFCPRPSCQRAYHQGCLVDAKSKESSKAFSSATITITGRSARKRTTSIHSKIIKAEEKEEKIESRALRLLTCSPDTNDVVDLESLIPITVVPTKTQHDSDSEPPEPPKKKRRGRPAKNPPPASPKETLLQQPLTLSAALALLPPDLLEVAQQPLVRGGAFSVGGVSGNIGTVTRARRLVYHILEGADVPDNWEELVFGKDTGVCVANTIVKLDGGKRVLPALICPKCQSAI
ncbi:hypothetical protein B0H34DRAFT_91636 [Crassisporium funariophilum]|nr:hypothetical protein B0H34DRAFT_91636 [Crassisporium funariophilum]